MNVDIVTVGGYETTGARNMTAVRVGGDVVVFDMGIDLGRILLHDDVEMERMHSLDLIDMGAIPDDRVMSDVEGDVKAIVFSHGHLDHLGAVAKLAHRYDAPILATPFTAELVEDQLADEETFERDNDVVRMSAGESTSLGEHCELEFVHVTHSIPDAVNPVLHTPEGAVVYGLDKRLDHSPVVGDPIDMDRFRELPEEPNGVLCYLEDCTNANRNGRTPSEAVARRHLQDVMTSMADYDGGILATTFASHVARVKSLVEFARGIGREPVLLGRSMDSYSSAAERVGLVEFPENVQSYGRYPERQRAFGQIMDEGKGEYLPIVTGHQGEPRAMLARIARGESPYELDEGDRVVFAARVIPEPTNEAQRHRLDTLLRMQGARVYDDIHVSGHLAREGHYEMLRALDPDHVVPAHGDMKRRESYVELAENEGYTYGRDLHVPRNGEVIELVD